MWDVIDDIVKHRTGGPQGQDDQDHCRQAFQKSRQEQEQKEEQEQEQEKVTIVIKMDIESFECRALLGSTQIFQDPRLFIPYIVMDWSFLKHVSAVSQPQNLLKLSAYNEYPAIKK